MLFAPGSVSKQHTEDIVIVYDMGFAVNPKPLTLNPNPSTLDPKP